MPSALREVVFVLTDIVRFVDAENARSHGGTQLPEHAEIVRRRTALRGITEGAPKFEGNRPVGARYGHADHDRGMRTFPAELIVHTSGERTQDCRLARARLANEVDALAVLMPGMTTGCAKAIVDNVLGFRAWNVDRLPSVRRQLPPQNRRPYPSHCRLRRGPGARPLP